MEKIKRIGIVAHDNQKKDMVEWVKFNSETLVNHKIYCTGTTGRLVETVLQKKAKEKNDDYRVTRLKSGPLGGDLQLGALIAEEKIDVIFFFWDPMQPHPHDVDVKALLRIAVLYNIPCASNRSTADFLISSPLFLQEYKPRLKDYSQYIAREI
ncbi:MAG: methylglyoxal synthase [Lentimicrobiaceae bacterium]|jgi:methylglyoxal synthase|nr:methylglyoxal synthase [Lentimicrobiaceae bacterium]